MAMVIPRSSLSDDERMDKSPRLTWRDNLIPEEQALPLTPNDQTSLSSLLWTSRASRRQHGIDMMIPVGQWGLRRSTTRNDRAT
jgi:hypothetical protein